MSEPCHPDVEREEKASPVLYILCKSARGKALAAHKAAVFPLSQDELFAASGANVFSRPRFELAYVFDMLGVLNGAVVNLG